MLQFGYRWLAPVDDPAPELLERSGLTDVQRQLLGAADRNPDGSVAKGLGARPIREWLAQHPVVSCPAEPEHLRGQRALLP
jgi:hypothetical protein